MNRRLVIIGLLLLPLVGCQSALTPAPGLSTIRIKVIAEPKVGVRVDNGVSLYDTSSSSNERGPFERVDYSALDEIVVWIEPADAGKLAPPRLSAATMDVNAQKPAASLSATASVGQRLIIHNNGSIARNFYSVSDGNDFDLGTIPPGGRAEYVVRSAGLIEVLAASSKDPVAEVYAAPTQWVSLTRAGGTVDFTDLPPGRYKVVSWHPRLPGSESSVMLSPNQTANISIKVGVNALPKVGPR